MDIGWPEILIIALVILVLFGSKKLPDAARSLGRSMRILKTEVKGMHDDDNAEATGQTTAQQGGQPTPALPPAAAAAPVPPGTSAAQPAAQPGDRSESR